MAEVEQETGSVLILLPQPFYEERGTSIAIEYLLRALLELGYAADVVCFEPGKDLDLPGTRLVRAPNPFRFRHVPIGLSGRKLLLDGFLVRTLLRQLRRRAYLSVHAVEEAGFIAAALCRRRGLFVTYDMASSLPEQLAQYRWLNGRVAQAMAGRLERWLLRNVDLVVCSAGLEEKVADIAPDTPLHTWQFPSSLDPPDRNTVARLRTELGISAADRVVLYIGSFARYQGVPTLAEAIPQVVEAHGDALFLFVGAASSAEIASVTSRIPDRLAHRVRIQRRVDREETPGYLALADVLVSPRIHGDNLPLKAFDYLLTAKPIVASDIPAHRAVFDESVALLPSATPEGFADAIVRVLADEELSESLAAAARAYSEEHLVWERFVQRVDGIMQQVGSSR